MDENELWVNMIYVLILLMCEYDLFVNMNYGWVGTHRQTNTQTDRHINTMTRPGSGAGLSENAFLLRNMVFEQKSPVYTVSETRGAPLKINVQTQEMEQDNISSF